MSGYTPRNLPSYPPSATTPSSPYSFSSYPFPAPSTPSPPTPNPAADSLLLSLLPSYILGVCARPLSPAFDTHNCFVGKRRLKAALLADPALQLLEATLRVSNKRFKELLNQVLAESVVQELIVEGKRRREGGANDQGEVDLSSGGTDNDDEDATPAYTTAPPYAPAAATDASTAAVPRAGRRNTRGDRPSSLVIPSTSTTTTTTGVAASPTTTSDNRLYLPCPLQHALLTSLQYTLESACHTLATTLFPSIFTRPKQAPWRTQPLLVELPRWEEQLRRELQRIDGLGTVTVDTALLRDRLEKLVHVRHDAVHRNCKSADVVGRYLGWGGEAVGMMRALVSQLGAGEVVVVQRAMDRLGVIGARLAGWRAAVEAALDAYAAGVAVQARDDEARRREVVATLAAALAQLGVEVGRGAAAFAGVGEEEEEERQVVPARSHARSVSCGDF